MKNILEELGKQKPIGIMVVECTTCRGYGKVLTSNDARCWRPCDNCNGFGYTTGIPKHEHKWKHSSTLGRCFNRYICTICSKTKDIDSGD